MGSEDQSSMAFVASAIALCPSEGSVIHEKSVDVVETFRIFSQSLRAERWVEIIWTHSSYIFPVPAEKL